MSFDSLGNMNFNYNFMTAPGMFNTYALPDYSNYTIIPPMDFGFPNVDLSKMFETVLGLYNQQQSLFAKNLESLTAAMDTFSFSNANYGNYNYDISTEFKGTAADLDKHLDGVLKGKGAKLLELQKKYGVSASILAAIAIHESANGTSDAAKNKNNVGGVMSASSGFKELATFDSVDECLEAMASNLKRNYIGQGLRSISQVFQKYCPIGAHNDPNGLNSSWGARVDYYNRQILNSASVA